MDVPALLAVLGTGGTGASFLGLFVANCFLGYALFAPWCNWLEAALTCFHTTEREVWLTIDDGPDGTRTLELLEALAARGVVATFFVKGIVLAAQPEIGRKILADGHGMGVGCARELR